MTAHFCEVIVWSLAYAIAVPFRRRRSVYFAFVNYTTLGYGDVTPVERWQLLGPMTAMNGVLLFGWSTAVIFEVLRRSLDWEARSRHEEPNPSFYCCVAANISRSREHCCSDPPTVWMNYT